MGGLVWNGYVCMALSQGKGPGLLGAEFWGGEGDLGQDISQISSCCPLMGLLYHSLLLFLPRPSASALVCSGCFSLRASKC